MTSTSSVAASFKSAFVAAAITLFVSDPSVQVSYGHPGLTETNDIVAFLGVRSQQVTATMGTNRSREEVLEIDVTVSIYRPGGPAMEEVATTRAYALLGSLENYVRTTDTQLGGIVRDCVLTAHESAGATDPEFLANGRLIEVSGTFTAHARITN